VNSRASKVSIVVLCLTLLACSSVESAYFSPGNETLTTVGADVGQVVYVGLIDLVAPGNDVATLESIAIASLPAGVTFDAFVLDRGKTSGAGVGALRGGEPSGVAGFPSILQSLAGYAIRPQVAPTEVVVRFTAGPGVDEVRFSAYELAFSVLGTSQTELFKQGVRICYKSALLPCPSGSQGEDFPSP
jgi:hypothetical protein